MIASAEIGGGGLATSARAAREDETTRPTPSGKSKWGRFMRNSSSSDAADAADATITRDETATATGNGKSSGNGNKIYPKLSRVPERQESVDEASSRVVTVRPVIESTEQSSPHKGDVGDVGGGGGVATSATTSIIDSFAQLKYEVRDEVQRINHKMTRLEDILGFFFTFNSFQLNSISIELISILYIAIS